MRMMMRMGVVVVHLRGLLMRCRRGRHLVNWMMEVIVGLLLRLLLLWVHHQREGLHVISGGCD